MYVHVHVRSITQYVICGVALHIESVDSAGGKKPFKFVGPDPRGIEVDSLRLI